MKKLLIMVLTITNVLFLTQGMNGSQKRTPNDPQELQKSQLKKLALEKIENINKFNSFYDLTDANTYLSDSIKNKAEELGLLKTKFYSNAYKHVEHEYNKRKNFLKKRLEDTTIYTKKHPLLNKTAREIAEEFKKIQNFKKLQKANLRLKNKFVEKAEELGLYGTKYYYEQFENIKQEYLKKKEFLKNSLEKIVDKMIARIGGIDSLKVLEINISRTLDRLKEKYNELKISDPNVWSNLTDRLIDAQMKREKEIKKKNKIK